MLWDQGNLWLCFFDYLISFLSASMPFLFQLLITANLQVLCDSVLGHCLLIKCFIWVKVTISTTSKYVVLRYEKYSATFQNTPDIVEITDLGECVWIHYSCEQNYWTPWIFPIGFYSTNKSCNIERCGNKMHQIVPNMMLSQNLRLK